MLEGGGRRSPSAAPGPAPPRPASAADGALEWRGEEEKRAAGEEEQREAPRSGRSRGARSARPWVGAPTAAAPMCRGMAQWRRLARSSMAHGQWRGEQAEEGGQGVLMAGGAGEGLMRGELEVEDKGKMVNAT